jgi:hypothetical protein
MTPSFAARLERFSYNNQHIALLLIEAAMANPAGESHREVFRHDSARRRMVQFRGPGVTADAGLLAFRPDIEILPLFADRRMELRAEGDAVERVDHGLAISLGDASDLPCPGLGAGEASQRFRQAKFLEWLAAGGSMFSTAMESSPSWRSSVPRYSVSRSVRTLRGTASLSAWKGKPGRFGGQRP